MIIAVQKELKKTTGPPTKQRRRLIYNGNSAISSVILCIINIIG